MHRIPWNPKDGARLDMVPDPFDLNLPRPLEHVVDLCLRMLVQRECSVGGTGRDPYAHGVGAGAGFGEECLPDHGAVFRVWERAEGCLADLVPIEDYWRLLLCCLAFTLYMSEFKLPREGALLKMLT
ncbi:hypothetical protein FGLOB1_2020 [Fusarium globosum]|uniref:Uncharacterized protein n=1 Tax=Fusarium globosum TaxID=78864 RepID=A0A8H6DHF3_9HYPO|nr:hypothetical protein FGLOB1_2020 [Fusarium globosum]